MSDVKKIPDGQGGIIPYLVVDNAAAAIDFYKAAFGAIEIKRAPTPDGKKLLHAALKIGSSNLYLCDDFPEFCDGKIRNPKALGTTPVTIHQYVEDCDAVIARAEKAGAKVTMKPEDTFWGDRYGTITDPFGHDWSFATHIKDLSPEEMAEAVRMASGAPQDN